MNIAGINPGAATGRKLKVWSIKGPGIQFTQQTRLRSDTGICHSGQAQRSAGISSFPARA